MTWRLLLAAVATTNNPLVTLITDDSPAPGSLARRRAIHPMLDASLGDTTFTSDRLDALRRGLVLEFTRFQTWQLYIDALHDDGAALRDLRTALYGEATGYRPDLMVPPADPEDRLVWEAERAHTLRLSEILDQVARYGRRLPETLYTSDIYNLARSVPWRPERSPNADDARALEALRERARRVGAARETGESSLERARYDAMAEAVVLVLGTYDQPATHRFGSRRGIGRSGSPPSGCRGSTAGCGSRSRCGGRRSRSSSSGHIPRHMRRGALPRATSRRRPRRMVWATRMMPPGLAASRRIDCSRNSRSVSATSACRGCSAP